MRQRARIGRGWSMIALDHLRALAPLVLQLERRLEVVRVQPRRRIQTGKDARRLDPLEAAVSDQPPDDRAILLLDEGLIVFLIGARARHLDLLRATPEHDHLVHERAVIVESAPSTSHGNRLCARSIAWTTSPLSRVTSGKHSVQPVATSTIVSVWMNEPATDVPPCATMSTSQKPGAGSFQSLNVRIGT